MSILRTSALAAYIYIYILDKNAILPYTLCHIPGLRIVDFIKINGTKKDNSI